MQTPLPPEIRQADLDAARRFLFLDTDREAGRRPGRSRRNSAPRREVAFHHGIARARTRYAAR